MKYFCLLISVFCFLPSLHAEETIHLKDHLISWWTGEPSSSGFRNDEYGSNHLGNAGADSKAEGRSGIATAFNGKTILHSKLSTDTHGSSLKSPGRDITYAGWVKFNSLDSEQTVAGRWSKWKPGCEHRLYLPDGKNTLSLVWAGPENKEQKTIVSKTAITAKTWYLIVYGRNNTDKELFLSVTSEKGPLSPAVRLKGVETNPKSDKTRLMFGGNSKRNQMKGLWEDWGVFSKTLTQKDIEWLFNNGQGREYKDLTYSIEPELGYFHDFEDENAQEGRYTYEKYTTATCARATDIVKDGKYSLKITGSWGQIQVFNNSNTDYWCTTGECRVNVDLYMVTYTGSMLFQIDGKCDNKDFDTNEGIGVMFREKNGKRGISFGARSSGYDLPLNKWVHLEFRYKRKAEGNTHEVYVDGKRIIAAKRPPGPDPVARTWHHISLGNDRIEKPVYYLDNFRVSPDSKLK